MTPKALIDQILQDDRNVYGGSDVKDFELVKELKKKTQKEIKDFILELLDYISITHDISDKKKYVTSNKSTTYACYVINNVLKKNQNYNEEEWIQLFDKIKKTNEIVAGRHGLSFGLTDFPLTQIIQQIEKFLKKSEMSSELEQYIKDLIAWEVLHAEWDDIVKFYKKLKTLVSSGEKFIVQYKDIGSQINTIIAESKLFEQPALHKILNMCDNVNSSNPTKKYSKETDILINEMGKDAYRIFCHNVIDVCLERPLEDEVLEEEGYNKGNFLFQSGNFIKGLVWTMQHFSDQKSIASLTKLFLKGYDKIPGIGAANQIVGNACAYTLGNMRGKDGLGALSRLKLKMKNAKIKTIIDKYLKAGSEKYNVSIEELKEMSVPHFQLKEGKKSIGFWEYSFLISIENMKVVQQWIKPDGKMMKSVPSVVKNDAKLKEKLKKVRAEVKEIKQVITSSKQHIDNQFILDRTWDFESFEKYYLTHGLVSCIANRLIWTFFKGDIKASAMLVDGQWQNAIGEHIDWIDDTCTIKLWHPIRADEKEITAWRDCIMRIECRQPFKQAFREIYVVTDAEITTHTYSNRMAAHILKQHQFITLAKLRDWKANTLGGWDGYDDVVRKELPAYKIVAEYWVDAIDDNSEMDAMGFWSYVATDQVKFKNELMEDIQMIDVPPMVFTEIMRDIDLFVGVTSVGNDPAWQNDNNRTREREYWTSYSFGKLSELAKTRKSILENMLPKLKKLKGKAKVEGRFLQVEGSIRNYKIHIGSGNILMEPNDQYLCIVPARNTDKATDKLFIPFEGDRGLSIVISKALLLVEDHKIKDTTILSQINTN